MALHILANENLPGEAVEALRRDGHDVVWVRTYAPEDIPFKEIIEKYYPDLKIEDVKDCARYV